MSDDMWNGMGLGVGLVVFGAILAGGFHSYGSSTTAFKITEACQRDGAVWINGEKWACQKHEQKGK